MRVQHLCVMRALFGAVAMTAACLFLSNTRAILCIEVIATLCALCHGWRGVVLLVNTCARVVHKWTLFAKEDFSFSTTTSGDTLHRTYWRRSSHSCTCKNLTLSEVHLYCKLHECMSLHALHTVHAGQLSHFSPLLCTGELCNGTGSW